LQPGPKLIRKPMERQRKVKAFSQCSRNT